MGKVEGLLWLQWSGGIVGVGPVGWGCGGVSLVYGADSELTMPDRAKFESATFLAQPPRAGPEWVQELGPRKGVGRERDQTGPKRGMRANNLSATEKNESGVRVFKIFWCTGVILGYLVYGCFFDGLWYGIFPWCTGAECVKKEWHNSGRLKNISEIGIITSEILSVDSHRVDMIGDFVPNWQVESPTPGGSLTPDHKMRHDPWVGTIDD